MSDIFERDEQHNFFELPQTPESYKVDIPKPAITESPQDLTTPKSSSLADKMKAVNEKIDKQLGFQESIRSEPGANLTLREYASISDMVDEGLIDDDEVYKMVSSKNLSEYLSEHLDIDLPTSTVFEFYDELFSAISEDSQERFATAKSRYEAVQNSIQIAKNNMPLSKMGNDLCSLNEQILAAGSDEKEALQKQADDLWAQISEIRKQNDELGKKFPKDALTTIMTSTIQSAPMTGKSVAAGVAGGLVTGAFGAVGGAAAGGVGAIPGFAGGFKIGYGLGSFAASSAEMAGLLYIDMIAAGMEQKTAAGLSKLGGGINGIIESSLGVVAGTGKNIAKTIGGKAISEEVQKKIAENAAKKFISNVSHAIATSPAGKNIIAKTAFDTAKQSAGEGLEEGLQYLVDHAMLAIGDAMQDSPVDRNLWGSPEFQDELRQSVIGGIAGGFGFGVIGLPLTITGNIQETARQTEQLKNLAITIDDKAEFKAAAKENPLTRNFSDKHFDEVFDSQETERQSYHSTMRDEAQRSGKNIAAMPTLEAPGEMRRQNDGRLSMRVTSPEDGSSGNAVLLDPPTKQRMGSIDFDWDIDSNTITIENIDLSQAITDREKVIGDMVKELSYKNPDMTIEWNPDAKASEAAGVDLEALKNNLIAENPRGEDWNLSFYQKGDRFTQSRAMNEDIDLIASSANVSHDIASDTYEAWNIAFRKFGLDTHDMIGKMGLTSESDLRLVAADNPQGVEAQVIDQLDAGKIAAQKIGETPAGGTIVLKKQADGTRRILYKHEAFKEAVDQLQAITVLTEAANPSTLHHEWLHFMVNVVIPNSQRYRNLLEDAVGKKLEDFTEQDHEWLADNYERYLKTGEAPTPGLKALFKRIAEALRDFVRNGTVSPKLREFFDEMLAGPDSAMMKGESQQATKTGTSVRIETDNEQQKAFAEMSTGERILQSDLHSVEEKAEVLYAMEHLTAEEQLKAVYDQYHNEDGTAKAGWLKAPNGKDTNLTEKQWLQVRTPNFKRWFGDWENILNKEILEGKSIYNVNSKDIPIINNSIIKSALQWIENNPQETAKTIIGDVLITRRGIKDDFSHINFPDKLATLPAIKTVLEKGAYLGSEKDLEGKNINNFYFAAPITIDSKDKIVFVRVRKKGDGDKRFYVHDIYTLDDIKKSGTTKTTDSMQNARNKGNVPDFYKSIINKVLSVNENVSKIIDENGEPQPLWHQTGADIEIFEPRHEGAGKFDNEMPFGIFLKPHDKDIGLAVKKQMNLFANITNPLHIANRAEMQKYLENNIEGYAELKKQYENNDEIQKKRLEEIEAEIEKQVEKWEEENPNNNIGTNEGMDERSAAIDKIYEAAGMNSFFDEWHNAGNNLSAQMKELVDKHFRDSGYDGIILEQDQGALGKKTTKTYVAFNSNQVKSATDNIGTFDPENMSILFQTGWHGSAYHFTRFDNRYMGKGVGAQAFGHGQYISSKKGVGDGYRQQFAEIQLFIDDKQIASSEMYKHIDTYESASDGRLDAHIKVMEEQLAEAPKEKQESYKKEIKLAKSLKDKNVQLKKGQLYKVEIPDNSELLMWDKELKSQKNILKMIREQAKKEDLDDILDYSGTGGEFYANELMKYLDSPKEASAFLYRAGVKGNKHWDNRDQAYNFVIFEGSDIDIVQMLFQKGWHGSPYKFDQFDSSHMGSGEGNQSYGWGHYFAGKKEVADYYREKLSVKDFYVDGEKVGVRDLSTYYFVYHAAKNNELEEHIQILENNLSNSKTRGDDNININILERNIAKAKELIGKKVENKGGHLYEVDIPGDEEMLDWDKTFVEQPEKIKTIIRNFIKDLSEEEKQSTYKDLRNILNQDRSGERIYYELERALGSDQAASQFLASLGIKGIRYLDGSSRSAGEGSHNYVIFDDNEIEITQMLFATVKLTEEQKEVTEAAKEKYGTTTNVKEAGYLLLDGSMLDFSGKNEGAPPGHRTLDHREMDNFEHNGKMYEPGKWNFIAQGNIRLMPEIGGICLSKLPNAEQAVTLKKYIQYFVGETIIDFVDDNSEAINSIEYNRGTHSTKILNDIKNYFENGIIPEQLSILLQMTRDEIHAEALRHSSAEAWMKADIFAEAFDAEASYRRDNKAEEPQTQEELEAWYKKQWDEAQVLAKEAALNDDGIRTPANAEAVDPALLDDTDEDGNLDWMPEQYEEEIQNEGNAGRSEEITSGSTGDFKENESGPNESITTSEANRRLISKLPSVIDDFVLIMGRTLRENLAHFGAYTAEDAAVRDQMERDKNRIYKEVHPYIRGLALGMTTGKKLSDKQRRTAMSHMRRSLESGATVYRELYTSLTEDSQFVSYAENEVPDTGAHGEAQKAAAEAQGLTAFQRTRLAENIIDKDIARKIRSGNATSEEIADYIKRRDEEIKELDNEIKTGKAELEKSKGETAEERAEVEAWRQQYYKTRKELQEAKKEAEQLQKKLAQARIAKTNAVERAKTGRENSEAILKERLAAKREEIKTLRKSMKDYVSHAKKQGKLEVAWKWAEERKKLSKITADRKRRIADRKAAKKYMEVNKKLAAWIMSADRIGMNVWVRQRELILGLQNALFNTSKIAAQARMYDAQIKAADKNLEKLCKKISKVTDEKVHADLERQINQQMEYLEGLKSSRNSIEIMGPYLAGVETDQAGDGTDTIDTGTIVYNGDTMSVEKFRELFYENKIRYGFMDAKLRKALRKSAPSAKSIGEKRKWSALNLAKGMSQEDLLAIQAVMRQLNKEGRANWERREFALRFNQKELTKTLIFNLDELEDDDDKEKTAQIKRYIKAMQTSNLTERERLLSKGTDIEKFIFESFDDKRLVQWMDGNKKGALYRFIIRERLKYANRRDTAIDKRTKRIMEIIGKETPEQQEANKNLSPLKRSAKMREQALKRIKELGEKNIRIEGVGPRRALRQWQYGENFRLEEAQTNLEMPTSIDVSLADLMFLVVALDNEFARSHYIYGNLWSADERAMYENMRKDNKLSAKEVKQIQKIGEEKEESLRAAINQHLFEDDGKGGRKAKNDLMQIVDAIRDDFESHFPETRAVYEDMFNQAVEGQDNYLPLIITEGKHAQAEKQNEIEALTQGSYQVKINPDKGMMLCRVDISPTHQSEIESDIFKVYFKGVEREEHFNKFAPHIRDINTVLRGLNNGSKQLSAKLTDIYGKWAVDRLYQHVNMIGLPPSAKLGNAWENAAGLGRMLAGNAGVAYIAYNIPAWLAQYPNSIAAFFGQADARFILSGCLEVMKPGNDLVERVFEKSPKVKQRVINVAEEYREHLAKQPGKLKAAHAKFIKIGMMGQRHADQTMVSIGWWALYQTALKNGKSEEDAIVFADEITAETQPDLNALETSPMYKDKGLGGLFLRFTQPLNQIWQNFAYDSIISREKSFAKTVPRIVAYGLAALIVGVMRGALANKDGEDLDKEELIRKVFYYMLCAQFAESIPLVGNTAAGTLERVITGEGVVYKSRYFELAERILNIPDRIGREDFEGAFEDAFRAFGLGTGLPVSQINRIRKAFREQSPWIIFGFDPN